MSVIVLQGKVHKSMIEEKALTLITKLEPCEKVVSLTYVPHIRIGSL